MKRPNKGRKRVVPQPGGEAFHVGEPAPLTYTMEMPPVKSRGRLIPADETLQMPADPRNVPTVALVPTVEEIAKLPATARAAFLARCAARVAPLVPQPAPAALDPQATVAILLAAATVRTPVRRLLRCIRRDYDRLFFLSKQKKWTDDTPMPENAFGPLWPKDLVLPWVKT